MAGLAGLGVSGKWSVDIDETDTDAWGLTVRCRGFCVQLSVSDLDVVRRVWAELAKAEEDVVGMSIGVMFGGTLLLTIADGSIVFRVAEERSAGGERYPALFSVNFDAQAERSDLAAAIKMALEEAEV